MIEETTDTTNNAAESSGTASPIIDSRFMFVDVAALRAKQLRRGALPRVAPDHHDATHKLERVAMEEVRRGLIDYSVPELKKAVAPEV
jgi:DNA-directed RNA polymerase omega subunit